MHHSLKKRAVIPAILLMVTLTILLPTRQIQSSDVYDSSAVIPVQLSSASEVVIPVLIRVGLVYNNASFTSTALSSDKGMDIGNYSGASFNILASSAPGETINVRMDAAGIAVSKSDGSLILTYSETLLPVVFRCKGSASPGLPPEDGQPASVIKFNSKNYRGEIETKKLLGNFTAVNIISPDEYLYGVVPIEIGGSSLLEAAKAQAVTARSYLITNLGKHSIYGFDVCSGNDCQGYSGYDRESAGTNRAVNETSGVVVLYDGKVAVTTYFSTSGGHTENSENVWLSAVPYLRGVPDPHESTSAMYANWQTVLTAADIKARTKGALGDITGLRVTGRSESGRVIELVIEGSEGRAVYTNEACRNIFGLRSQLYTVYPEISDLTPGAGSSPGVPVSGSVKLFAYSADGTMAAVDITGKNAISLDGIRTIQALPVIYVAGMDKTAEYRPGGAIYTGSFTFTGKGYGHGVGMSQMGAIGMAGAGYTYDLILKHYYTGITLTSPK